MAKWETVRLGDVLSLSSGKFLPERNRIGTDFPVYGGNGVTGFHNTFFVGNKTIVIGRVGEYCGSIHKAQQNSWITDNALYITKLIDRVALDYLYYALLGLDLNQYSNQSGQPSLSQPKILVLTIPLPPLPVQQQIADSLDKASELIEKRKAQIKKLDLLIKSQFIEMFGDPVINPMGWEVASYEDISVLITDGEHITPVRSKSGYYLLSARNILNHCLQLDDVDYIGEEEYIRISKRIKPKKDDILISCSGSVGRVCKVPANFQCQMVRSVAIMRLNGNINAVFMEWLISSDYTQGQIAKSVNQSSQANLFQGKIKQLKTIVPPLSLQTQFADFVKQVEAQKALMQKSLEKLELNYKSIMQKCFRGEIF